MMYADRDTFRIVYHYLRGDEKVRREFEIHRGDTKRVEFLGLRCFLEDYPEAETWTWQDVQEKLQNQPVPPSLVPIIPEPPLPSVMEDKVLIKAFPPPQTFDEKLGAIVDSLQEFRERLQIGVRALHEKSKAAEEEIRRLKLENAFLRGRVEEYAKIGDSAHFATNALADTISDIANFFSIAKSGLPVQTAPSKTKEGWAREFGIIYHDAFKERFFGDYLEEHERTQVVKALNNFAREGYFYSGPKPKKFRRLLPGIPSGTGAYWYARASDRLRFSFKQMGGEGLIHLFNIHDHTEID
jgi:hypothetical protein